MFLRSLGPAQLVVKHLTSGDGTRKSSHNDYLDRDWGCIPQIWCLDIWRHSRSRKVPTFPSPFSEAGHKLLMWYGPFYTLKTEGHKDESEQIAVLCPHPRFFLLNHTLSVLSIQIDKFLSFLSFFFCLVGLGFELRASHLQSRHSIAWATPPSILLWLFWRWGLANYLPGLAWHYNSPDVSLSSS
jgi:hypothetical protein